ncbi:MAG: hypothetical protein ACHQIM_11590 [Sphingobacteriales bacterium]
MKQLLLNSLFIAGSAFIYIQGARLLTINNKIFDQQSSGPASPKHIIKKQHKSIGSVMNTALLDADFKDNALTLFFNKLPNITGNAYNETLVYNPYINFTYYDLILKNPEWSQSSK